MSSSMPAALPAFCFKGLCPDGRTTVYVNVVGDPDPSLIPVTRGGNVPLGTKGIAANGEPTPTLQYLDTHGLGNLMVPIAVGESRKLANPNKPHPSQQQQEGTDNKDDPFAALNLGNKNSGEGGQKKSKGPLVEEVTPSSSAAATSTVAPKKSTKTKSSSNSTIKSTIDYENSLVVDVVVYSGVTHRVHPLHPLFESYITHLIPLTLQWVQQEQGLVILPNTVAMLTVLDPSIRASEATARRIGEKIISGMQGDGLRGTKYVVGERKNMIFPPGTQLSDDPSQAAAIKAQEEEAAFWSKINQAADAMTNDFKKAEEAKMAAAEESASEAASQIPRDFLVSSNSKPYASGVGAAPSPSPQPSSAPQKKSPLIQEIFGDDDDDDSTKKAEENKKKSSTGGEGVGGDGSSFVKRGFLNQKGGKGVGLYPEGGSSEGAESARKAAESYREAQLANIPAALRGKCQIVDMTGLDDKKTKKVEQSPQPTYTPPTPQPKPAATVASPPPPESVSSAAKDKDILIEDVESDWTHTITWNGSQATITVEISRVASSGATGPPEDVEIEPTHIDIDEGAYIIALVAQQSPSTPLFQLTVDHENASASYSKKKGILTIKADVLAAKKT